MGIINWVQNRLNAKQDRRRNEAAAAAAVSSSARSRGESCRQEARDQEKIAGDCWPVGGAHGLLSIGTLGNESPPPAAEEAASAAQDVADFTIEEVKKLQEALNKLLRRAKSKSSSRGSTADHDDDQLRAGGAASLLPLDRFLNCPSSLEVDRRISLRHAAADGGQNGEFSPDTQIILSKARDLLVNTNATTTIKQKSFKFLLKKMFVCRGGFSSPSPAPSLKDPVESRIEKLFRTMLHKRMNARPSNAAAASSRKYYLEDKPRRKMQSEHLHDDEDDDSGEDIFKWDKTDSDFIVLEM
ncbi:protein NEGATIVE GRAVITROPIC RESPONSE OF ROOTS [Oryza brachyantha]|uniref:protein NEGATIVE GRAVITROPIC RESPONSE OF ROOTS n=1 Tax=Oryza brachyantha TaxID=4533 RepID=UPI001ADB6640|nr:protein NEGATIVE GRAVITROPIC RESPONSE OF ROOTS [Oryza brachyantha]